MQTPFGTDNFAGNPDPRCPCVLLLDVSGSMTGDPIQQLNIGLAQFKQELVADQIASRRAEIATITFGPVTVVNDFVVAEAYEPPVLSPQGDTPMGAAIIRGIELVQGRKATYKEAGVMYFRPWIFLITDGAPTDAYQGAAMAVREGEAAGKFSFWTVGVSNANMQVLSEIAPTTRPPVKLDGLRFRDLFSWLSATMRSRSASTPGEKVLLPAITGPAGWAVSD